VRKLDERNSDIAFQRCVKMNWISSEGNIMNVAVELPDDIALQLEAEWKDVSRRVLEAIAVEGYRSGALTKGQVQRVLSLSWWETESFLKERQGYLHYDETDLERDRATLERVMKR
jgi:predicted HTH domain antitoxin